MKCDKSISYGLGEGRRCQSEDSKKTRPTLKGSQGVKERAVEGAERRQTRDNAPGEVLQQRKK